MSSYARDRMPAVARVAAPVGAASLVLAAALWAFAPLEVPVSPAPASLPKAEDKGSGAKAGGTELVALDKAAFRAPLWIAPPPPPAPVVAAPPAPPPPLKLQLLAIIKEDALGANGETLAVYKAMVYDPDSDKVLVVAAGDTLGGRTVESIDQTALRIKDERGGGGGGGTRVLTLKTEGGSR